MDKPLYYSGVGARVTPQNMLDKMTEFGRRLNAKGYVLRSGKARGADTAWEQGAGHRKEIFKPTKWVHGNDLPTLPEAYDIAQKYHDYWSYLPDWHKELLARNVHIVLGPRLDDPVEFVVCWTQDGIFRAEDRTKKSGGTGHTIAVACGYGVPVFNLNNRVHYEFVDSTLTR